MRYADKCEHTDRQHCAKGMCASCYQLSVYRNMSPEQKAKHANRSKKWNEQNPEERQEISLRSKLKKLYNLDWYQYEILMLIQGGTCGICGQVPDPDRDRLHIDHDHSCCPGETSCGKCIRGLLCDKCNRGIGQLNDDPALLRNAIEFLTEA